MTGRPSSWPYNRAICRCKNMSINSSNWQGTILKQSLKSGDALERGLKHELKKVITPLRERRFPILVEQAKSAEYLERGPTPASQHQKNVAEARQMKKLYSRPQTSQGPTCYHCGGPHLKRNCPQITSGVGGSGDRRKYFICDKSGHFANNCPEKKSVGAKKPTASPAERARAAGRVFTMTST